MVAAWRLLLLLLTEARASREMLDSIKEAEGSRMDSCGCRSRESREEMEFGIDCSMSIRWPGRSLGSHAWILIAMLQLAVDFPSCDSLGPGPEFRLLSRPQRPQRLWSLRSGPPTRLPTPAWSPRAARAERSHGPIQMQTPRARRAHRPRDQVATLGPKGGLTKPPAATGSSPSLTSASASSSRVAAGTAEHQSLLRGRRHTHDTEFNDFNFRGSRPTTETEFIAWGPTGDEEALESNTFPGGFGPTTVSILQTRKTTVATTTTTTASTATAMTLQTKGVTESLDPWKRTPVGVSTTEPSTSPSNNGKDIQPPRILGETSAKGEKVGSSSPPTTPSMAHDKQQPLLMLRSREKLPGHR
ncbi:adherens junction-associated protein 1 [Cricetulus griseus]|uniref:adherens junction-associated protein 1 n=1 Tax=Cricetulus griseus TaxID=10029 RepID=UPI00022F674E|nr:adherens junction-associated protein 1 [Cricetulus griseus]